MALCCGHPHTSLVLPWTEPGGQRSVRWPRMLQCPQDPRMGPSWQAVGTGPCSCPSPAHVSGGGGHWAAAHWGLRRCGRGIPHGPSCSCLCLLGQTGSQRGPWSGRAQWRAGEFPGAPGPMRGPQASLPPPPARVVLLPPGAQPGHAAQHAALTPCSGLWLVTIQKHRMVVEQTHICILPRTVGSITVPTVGGAAPVGTALGYHLLHLCPLIHTQPRPTLPPGPVP